jgi:hypothetical protein
VMLPQTSHGGMGTTRFSRACPLRARQNGESRGFTVTHGNSSMSPDLGGSSSATLYPEPSKLVMRVRFPSPAPTSGR